MLALMGRTLPTHAVDYDGAVRGLAPCGDRAGRRARRIWQACGRACGARSALPAEVTATRDAAGIISRGHGDRVASLWTPGKGRPLVVVHPDGSAAGNALPEVVAAQEGEATGAGAPGVPDRRGRRPADADAQPLADLQRQRRPGAHPRHRRGAGDAAGGHVAPTCSRPATPGTGRPWRWRPAAEGTAWRSTPRAWRPTMRRWTRRASCPASSASAACARSRDCSRRDHEGARVVSAPPCWRWLGWRAGAGAAQRPPSTTPQAWLLLLGQLPVGDAWTRACGSSATLERRHQPARSAAAADRPRTAARPARQRVGRLRRTSRGGATASGSTSSARGSS